MKANKLTRLQKLFQEREQLVQERERLERERDRARAEIKRVEEQQQRLIDTANSFIPGLGTLVHVLAVKITMLFRSRK
jgi:predicted nuclease with TOPRIM domain